MRHGPSFCAPLLVDASRSAPPSTSAFAENLDGKLAAPGHGRVATSVAPEKS
ncbi:MAG: hypothetical protein R3F56_21670 [Planctomycetota bacterium]